MGRVRQKDDRGLYDVFVPLSDIRPHEKLPQEIEKASCPEIRVA